jgi:PTH1 family peptidyl-tRNA hydrolase
MSSETDTSTMFNPRFLVVSLGNPAPYHESIHSAGHIALAAVQQKLRTTQPAFTSLRFGKKATQTSLGPKYDFLQSPTQMNVTGPWLTKAHKDILTHESLSSPDMGLVVVHDDLEEEFGIVKIRKWDQSHRGHNGVKSIAASLKQKSKSDFSHIVQPGHLY